MISATDVWASPEWYPVRIDVPSRTLQFVRMSPDTYRASVFLDSRMRHLSEICQVTLEDLLSNRPPRLDADASVHYIFHTAFCCSTLLARYIELLPHVLVLKEPGILSQVAVTPWASDREQREAVKLTLALLSRTYEARHVVAIKASDWCNSLATTALHLNKHSTATFQMVPLRSFLLAVLKSARRRRWAHSRARLARRDTSEVGFLSNISAQSFSDAQAAAFIWIANARTCEILTKGVHAGRVKPLDGEHLAAQPGPQLHRVIADSCLDRHGIDYAHLANSSVSHSYSKGRGGPFNHEQRTLELRRLEERLRPEVDAGLSWAAEVGTDAFCGQPRTFARWTPRSAR
jgi:hypothetical protein